MTRPGKAAGGGVAWEGLGGRGGASSAVVEGPQASCTRAVAMAVAGRSGAQRTHLCSASVFEGGGRGAKKEPRGASGSGSIERPF